MYAVDGAALSDRRADTKQPDGPRYPATDASSGRIHPGTGRREPAHENRSPRVAEERAASIDIPGSGASDASRLNGNLTRGINRSAL
jgi:hypothetical protein